MSVGSGTRSPPGAAVSPKCPTRWRLKKKGRSSVGAQKSKLALSQKASWSGAAASSSQPGAYGPAGRVGHAVAAFLSQPSHAAQLGLRKGLELGEDRPILEAVEWARVLAQDHDHIALGVLDALPLQRLERQHGGAQCLVDAAAVGARDVQETAGRQVLEVLLERLDRVEIVLGERERLRRVAAVGIGEAEVDLVIALVALGERRSPVADRRVHVRQRVRRARDLPQVVVDHAAYAPVQLDHMHALALRQRGEDVAPPPPPMMRVSPGPVSRYPMLWGPSCVSRQSGSGSPRRYGHDLSDHLVVRDEAALRIAERPVAEHAARSASSARRAARGRAASRRRRRRAAGEHHQQRAAAAPPSDQARSRNVPAGEQHGRRARPARPRRRSAWAPERATGAGPPRRPPGPRRARSKA